MLFKQLNQRFTTRNLYHTQSSLKKSLQTQTTRTVQANGRLYRTLQINPTPKRKTSKKKYNNINLFDRACKTVETITPLSSKRFIRPTSQRSKKGSELDYNQSERFNRTPLAKYFRNSMRNQQSGSIHETVVSKCLTYVKDMECGKTPLKTQSTNKSCDNTMEGKREKMILELKKQSMGMKRESGHQKDRIVLGDCGTFKPMTELQRLGRLAYKNRADRQMFRIELNPNQQRKQSQIKKSNKKIKEKQTLKQYIEDQKIEINIEKQFPRVELKQSDFQFQQHVARISKPSTSKQLCLKLVQKQKQNLSLKSQHKTNKELKISFADVNVVHEPKQQKHFKEKEIIKKDIYIQNNNKNRTNSIQSLEQIHFQLKQQDLIFQLTQRNDTIQNDRGSIKQSSQSSSHSLPKQQPIIAPPQHTVQSLKQKNQLIRPVGQIIGHGLKMLKGININWILPCIPVYKTFYQIRVEIQDLAERCEVENPFISKNRYENERIEQSYKNMMKAAEKKPLTKEEAEKISTSKITDAVTLFEIIDEIEKYQKVIGKSQLKPEHKSLVKIHFAMLINSVLVLAHYQKRVKFLNKINQESIDIELEIGKGMKMVKAIKQDNKF